jgi:hypothetical protein
VGKRRARSGKKKSGEWGKRERGVGIDVRILEMKDFHYE